MDVFLQQVVAEVRAKRGIDFSGYREATLRRRVMARMARVSEKDSEAYLRLLASDAAECDRLVESITINVSAFFRDPIVYETLAADVLPEIIARKRAANSREIRVWSAGCARGEEPYSIAILLAEALEGEHDNWSRLVFATDLDNEALRRARAGIYAREQLKDTKLSIVDKYFTVEGRQFALRPGVRDTVQFTWGDVVGGGRSVPSASIFGSFDLVLCRNVLIYFSAAAQSTAFAQLEYALAPGGYLVLGEAETLPRQLQAEFQTADARSRIYYKLPQRRKR